jgi:hypothetical protein
MSVVRIIYREKREMGVEKIFTAEYAQWNSKINRIARIAKKSSLISNHGAAIR